ncbi:MAG TPA: amino acid permease [Victivallales bacterium]|nr:amino acid permease [Victivallales bacterium]
MKLKKELSFIHVFCIATGAMISSGIFILPGMAYSNSGPLVFVSYCLAGIMALLGALSVIELSTAMPKAGGDYYFVTRSLGPLSGTISGLFSWLAIALKSSFAIFGMAEIIYLLTGFPLIISALILCVIFVVINIYGVQETAKLEVILVLGLLLLMVIYIFVGSFNIQPHHFTPLLPKGINPIFATAGFVFVSYGGLISITSISEEVKNPKKNIPLGLISSVIIVTIIYTVLLFITVGGYPGDKLSVSLTPVADTARVFMGTPGFVIITIAAILAFVTTAIAGIMSASRYPVALGRDCLIPQGFMKLSKRSQTPIIALVTTGILIGLSLFLKLDTLVKAASTVVLAANVFANVAVIILRESKLQNYNPSFKAPFYPWLQIISIIVFSFFIIDMGLATIEIFLGLLILAVAIYYFYGKSRSKHEYALLHLLARITNKQIASNKLEEELKNILVERDEIVHDRFDDMIKKCHVLDFEKSVDGEKFITSASDILAPEINITSKELVEKFVNREKESSTVLTETVAIPHIIIEGEKKFTILMARCKDGIKISDGAQNINAVFVIIGTKDERNFHLKTLAAIAQTIDRKDFQKKWLNAKGEDNLKDIFLLSDRSR